MKKTAFLLAAVMLLSGCAKGESSSLTEQEKLESELDGFNQENPYAFLPDGVDLNDKEHVQELEPDDEYNINYEKMGVRFPYSGKAYLYERDPWGIQHTNIYCQAAIIVTTEFFPELNDYVMIQPFTDIEPYIVTYGNAIEHFNKDAPSLKDEAAYLEEVRREIGMLAPYFAAHEVMYCYDFFDIPDNSFQSDPSGDEYKMPMSTNIQFVGAGYGSTTHKWTPPETERSEPVYEALELPDGRFAVKICYTQKRYGIENEKEVYWIYCNGGKSMHRVEFSHTPGAERLIEPESFLSELELYDMTTDTDEEAIGIYNYFPPHEE